jgi:hypothetical protein
LTFFPLGLSFANMQYLKAVICPLTAHNFQFLLLASVRPDPPAIRRQGRQFLVLVES